MKIKAKKQAKSEGTKLPFQQSPKWIESERGAIQDYLHGHIPNDEVKAAVCYEFARESASFLYAAAMFRQGAADEICAPFGIARNRPDDFDFLIMQFPGRTIWNCPRFPRFPWAKLTPREKEEIQRHFGHGARPRPFNTLDAELLAAMKVIEKLQSLAGKTRKEREKVSFHKQHNVPEKPVLAAVRDDQLPWIEHIVCTLDYRYGKDALVDAFRAWIKFNRTKYFDDYYYKPPIQRDSEHSLRRYREALKNLTAARLYATLGLREAKKWTAENHKLKNGAHLGYFGQKVRKKLNPGLKYLKKSESGAYKGGALFEDSRQWEKAVEESVEALKTLSGFGLILE